MDIAGRRLCSFDQFNLGIESSSSSDCLRTSLALVLLLVGFVPFFAVGTRLSLLSLVPAAGLVYFVYIYYTSSIFAGACSALFVLSLFNANIPIIRGPRIALLDIMLVDVVAIPLLLYLIYSRRNSFLPLMNQERLVIVAFAFFVGWSFISMLVGNGPSRLAALIFSVEQLRYLLLLVVSLTLVYYTNIWYAVYPLSVGIAGNLVFSLLEAFNGGWFELSYLGESPGAITGSFSVASITLKTGLYTGGFVGNSRELTALLLLFVSFVLAIAVYRPRRSFPFVVGSFIATALSVRIADTDAGFMALLFEFLLLAVVFGYSYVHQRRVRYGTGAMVSLLGAITNIGLYLARDVTSRSTQTTDSSVPNGAGGTGGTASWGISNIIALVPFLQMDTLAVRFNQYASAFEIAKQYPIFGLGGYNFYIVAESFGLPTKMGIHNLFFAQLAATGIPGFVAYMVATVGVVLVILRRVRITRGRRRLVWATLGCGVLGFYAYAFWVVAFNWPTVNAAFWLFVGAILGSEPDIPSVVK